MHDKFNAYGVGYGLRVLLAMPENASDDGVLMTVVVAMAVVAAWQSKHRLQAIQRQNSKSEINYLLLIVESSQCVCRCHLIS